MERIPRKKRKPRISTNIKIISIITIIIILTIIFLTYYKVSINDNPVIIKNIYFENIKENDMNLKFELTNKDKKDKTCNINISILDTKYNDKINISAKNTINYETKIFMPYGQTDYKIDFNCFNIIE
jgi:hypothetical protein